MFQTFIEKNRKLLKIYYHTSRIGGWIFVSIALLALFGHGIALASRLGDPEMFCAYLSKSVPWKIFTDLLPSGILVLGVAQLIRCLLDIENKPGWILRHADKLLYTYSAIYSVVYIWLGILEVIEHYQEPYDFPSRMIFFAVFVVTKLLLLIGLAQIVRRFLPVIEEFRTLV